MGELNDDKKYIEEWTRTQLHIWQEKIERMKVVYTGNLHQSFNSRIQETANGTSITMTFLRYGLYQAYGVCNGYKKGNDGDLLILDPEYRREAKLDIPRRVGKKPGGYLTSGKPRQRRDWFSKKLYMSVRAMIEDLARITGEEAARVVCDAVDDSRNALR